VNRHFASPSAEAKSPVTLSSHERAMLFPIAGVGEDEGADEGADAEWLKLPSSRAGVTVDATRRRRERERDASPSSTSASHSLSASRHRRTHRGGDGKKSTESSSRGKRKKSKTTEAEKIARAEEFMGTQVKDRRVSDREMWDARASGMKAKSSYEDRRADRDNLAYGALSRGDMVKFKRDEDRARPWYERAAKIRRSAFYGLKWAGEGTKDVKRDLKKERYFSGGASMRARDRRIPKLRKPSLIKGEDKNAKGDFVPLNSKVPMANGEGAEPTHVEDAGMESVNSYLMRRTKMFNQAVRERPQDTQVWIDFARFQDQFLALTNKRSEAAQLVEKKIAIIEQALRHHPQDETLLLMFMSEVEKIEESSAVLSKWNAICERNPHNREIWHAFIRYRKRDFNTFNVSQIRSEYHRALRALAAARRSVTGDAHESECAFVDFVIEACRYDIQSGATERAVARAQATVEFGCFSPTGQSEAELLDSFESFWECGEPRIGEKDARGWSYWLEKNAALKSKLEVHSRHANQTPKEVPPPPLTMPPPSSNAILGGGWKDFDNLGDFEQVEGEIDVGDTEGDEDSVGIEPDAAAIARLEEQLEAAEDREVDDDILDKWIAKESERDEIWMPVRLIDAQTAEDDVEKIGVIEFDDVKDGLLVLTTQVAQVRLCLQVLRLLAQAADFEPDTKNGAYGRHIDYMENVESTRQPYLSVAKMFAHFEMPSSTATTIHGTPQHKMWLFQMRGLENAWDAEESTRVTFVKNLRLAFAFRFPNEMSFTNLLKPNAEQVKQLLAGTHGNSLELWASLAVMEGQGRLQSLSRKIFSRAFASAPSLGVIAGQNVSHLAWCWVSQELRNDPSDSKNYAKSVLCSLADMSLGKSVSPESWKDDAQYVMLVKTAFRKMTDRALLGGGVSQSPNLPPNNSPLYGLQSHGVALIRCYDAFLKLVGDSEDVIDAALNAADLTTQRRTANATSWHELHCAHVSGVSGLGRKRAIIERALRVFPSSPNLLMELCALEYEVRGKQRMRRFFDLAIARESSAMLVFCSLGLEISKPLASNPRAISVFERALDRSTSTSQSPLLWLLYMQAYVMSGRMSNAKTVFLRAINTVPWNKTVWLYGLEHIKGVFTAKERSALIDVMREKEVTVRTDIYEILLESAVET